MTLPLEGSAVEKNRLDCKARYDDGPGRAAEMAKDVAAFANANGGRLLIGSVEAGGILKKHVGLAPDIAIKTRRAIEEAVRDFVRPPPVIDFPEPYPLADGKVVLIVEVEPFPGQAIGVRTGPQDGASWVFPVRVGTQTVWYSPEQLVLLMDVAYRRRIQSLQGINGQPVDLHHGAGQVTRCTALAVNEGAATVRFSASFNEHGHDTNVFALPIDYLTAVWQSDGVWGVRFRGGVLLSGGKATAKILVGAAVGRGGAMMSLE